MDLYSFTSVNIHLCLRNNVWVFSKLILSAQAKRQYEETEKKKEKARLAGEGTWMLSSVSDRIDREEEVRITFYFLCVIKTKQKNSWQAYSTFVYQSLMYKDCDSW